MKTAAECGTMADIRAGIERVDGELVRHFAKRTSCTDRAAQIKGRLGMPARVTPCVEEAVRNVRAEAVRHGRPPELIETLWRHLIVGSIAREEGVPGPERGERVAAPAVREQGEGT